MVVVKAWLKVGFHGCVLPWMPCHFVITTYPANDADNSRVYGMDALYVTMA